MAAAATPLVADVIYDGIDYTATGSAQLTATETSLLVNDLDGSGNSGFTAEFDPVLKVSYATDYNSSRSNKNANKLAVDADSDDSETNGTRATDYNSSRSNKADSIVSDEGSDDDSDEGEPAAKSKD